MKGPFLHYFIIYKISIENINTLGIISNYFPFFLPAIVNLHDSNVYFSYIITKQTILDRLIPTIYMYLDNFFHYRLMNIILYKYLHRCNFILII